MAVQLAGNPTPANTSSVELAVVAESARMPSMCVPLERVVVSNIGRIRDGLAQDAVDIELHKIHVCPGLMCY
jgi:hypothetical protein